jgi:hypothetical protein
VGEVVNEEHTRRTGSEFFDSIRDVCLQIHALQVHVETFLVQREGTPKTGRLEHILLQCKTLEGGLCDSVWDMEVGVGGRGEGGEEGEEMVWGRGGSRDRGRR